MNAWEPRTQLEWRTRGVSSCNRFAPAHSILVKEANMHKEFDSRLDQAWWALWIGLGVGPFLAGLDKYFNLLTNWTT